MYLILTLTGLLGIIFLLIDEVIILFVGLEDKKQRKWLRITGVVFSGIFVLLSLVLLVSIALVAHYS